MKILVSGGTGFVGAHAVPALLEAGHEVRLLARSREKVRAVLGAARGNAALGGEVTDLVLGDIGDAATVGRALEGCDAVLHAAADVTIGRARGGAAAGSDGSHNVLGAAVERGLDPVVHLSSVVALAPRGERLRADDPVATPGTGYASAKAAAERYARALQAADAPLVIVYPSGVYGPDDPGLGDPAKGLRDRLRFGWPRTRGGNACVDVRDLARLLTALMQPGRGPRRYMAGGHFLTWAQEADLCEALVGRPLRRVPAPPPLVRAAGRVVDLIKWLRPSFDYPLSYEAALLLTAALPCDSTAATDELGIAFRPSEETLRDAIAWLVRAGHLEPRWAPKLAGPGRALGY
jgi:nucleoside-diphosphate-sugar epimerase